MVSKACKKCNRICEENICPNCGSHELSNRFQGMIIVIDPNKSEIARKINVQLPGEYALEVL